MKINSKLYQSKSLALVLVLAVTSVTLMSACGKKGSLYLPTQPTPEKKPEVVISEPKSDTDKAPETGNATDSANTTDIGNTPETKSDNSAAENDAETKTGIDSGNDPDKKQKSIQ